MQFIVQFAQFFDSYIVKSWGDSPVMANPPEQERSGDFGITEDLPSGVGVYYAPTNESIGENP